jgi:hypothetical protein
VAEQYPAAEFHPKQEARSWLQKFPSIAPGRVVPQVLESEFFVHASVPISDRLPLIFALLIGTTQSLSQLG